MIKYNFEREAKSDDEILIKKLVTTLVNECGYKHELQDNRLIFNKGNIWSNLVQFNPADWKSEMIIISNGKSLKFVHKISTFGQIATKAEKEYWNNFQKEIIKLINGEDFDAKALKSSSTKASQINYVILLIIIVIAIVVKCS